MAKKKKTSKSEIIWTIFLLIIMAIGISTLYVTAGNPEQLVRDFAVSTTSLAFILLVARPLLKKSIFM